MIVHTIPNIIGRDAMIAALVSIGFVEEEGNTGYLFWGKDTDRQFRIHVPVSNNGYIYACPPTGTTDWTAIGFGQFNPTNTNPYHLHYRYLNDGILFYITNSLTPQILGGIVSPFGEDDEWVVFSNARIRFLNTALEFNCSNTSSMGTAVYPLTAISVGKFYVNRFIENILYSAISPQIPSGYIAKVDIGDKKYLLLNPIANSAVATKYAFDITNEPDDE